MSKHHEHHDHAHHQHETPQEARKRAIHRDWRLWVAVALMLGAMGMYVASLDEAEQPGGNLGPEVPATAE